MSSETDFGVNLPGQTRGPGGIPIEQFGIVDNLLDWAGDILGGIIGGEIGDWFGGEIGSFSGWAMDAASIDRVVTYGDAFVFVDEDTSSYYYDFGQDGIIDSAVIEHDNGMVEIWSSDGTQSYNWPGGL